MIMNASSSLRWLDRATPNIDEAKAALQAIVKNGNRADEVIENIRTLFKRDARTRTSLDVNNLIREALALVRDGLLEEVGVDHSITGLRRDSCSAR